MIEVKRKVSAKRVLWLFFTFFRYLAMYKGGPGRSLGPADTAVETRVKNCRESFCNP